MKIICSQRFAYKWYTGDNGYFRGYIQLQDGSVLHEANAINYFAAASDFREFKSKLAEIDGCFAVIVLKDGKLWAAVDIARSMPLYYSLDYEVISDSSEIIRSVKNIALEDTSVYSMLEMFATDYVANENTVYEAVKQIEIGCAAEFSSSSCKVEPYFIHTSPLKNMSREEAKEQLSQLTEKMADRLLSVIGNRPIVVSLSGGYDSRYVVCALKDKGIDNVICYTYGKIDSFETVASKKVADALGYDWYCVEYTDEKVKNILSEENMEYFAYCNEHDSIVYLQNYIAVKELKESGVIPDNAVFMTGLCNDMPTGSYIPSKDQIASDQLCNRKLAEHLYNRRFVRVKLCDDMREQNITATIDKLRFFNLKVTDYQSFVSAEDCMETGYIHSRFFLNMNKVHEFFGHEWLLPCWNRELLKFWYSLPAVYRYKQKLYEEYITECLSAKYGVGTKKSLADHGKTEFARKLKRFVGSGLVRVAYRQGIPIRRSADINNFAPLEVLLYQKIAQKGAVEYKHAAITLLLIIWHMEQRYGKSWYSRIKGALLDD